MSNAEATVKAYDWAMTPLATIPRAPELSAEEGAKRPARAMIWGAPGPEPLTYGTYNAIQNTIAPIAEGATSPAGIGALALGPLSKVIPAAKVASGVVAAGFATLMAKGTAEQIVEAKKVLADPNATPQQVKEAILAPAASLAMTVGAGFGAKSEFTEAMKPSVSMVAKPSVEAPTKEGTLSPETPAKPQPEVPGEVTVFHPDTPIETEAPKTDVAPADTTMAKIQALDAVPLKEGEMASAVKFDPEAPISTAEPAPESAANVAPKGTEEFDENVPPSQPVKSATFEPDTPVDIGPRDETVSTGTGVATPHEEQMMADWKKSIAAEQEAKAPQVLNHFTTAENAASLQSGSAFDATRLPVHGTGGLGPETKVGKFAGDAVYLSLDDKKWNSSYGASGGGKVVEATLEQLAKMKKEGTSAAPYFDYDKQKWMVDTAGVKKSSLSSVPMEVPNGLSTLNISNAGDLRRALADSAKALGVERVYWDTPEFWKGLKKSYDAVKITGVDDVLSKDPDSKFFKAAKGDQLIVFDPNKVRVENKVQPTTAEPLVSNVPATAPVKDLNAPDTRYDMVKSLNESKLLALSKQLDIDPQGMSGDRLKTRISVNASPEDIQAALAGKGLISNSAAEAWADKVLAKKRGQVNALFDPEQSAAYAVKGAAILERGITDFARWSKEMVKQFGEEITPRLEALFRSSRELHNEGSSVGNASPEQITDFLADFNEDAHAKIDEATAKATTPGTRALSLMSNVLHGSSPEVNSMMRGLANESAPKTSALNEDAGNALVRYASAKIAAPEIARDYAGKVLGDHLHDSEFAKKLGAVLVEDRLQTMRRGFLKQASDTAMTGDREGAQPFLDHAQNVTTLIGKENSPFKTEADFKAALNDPEIKSALDRHKELLQPFAKEMHENLGGQLAKAGDATGAFANLLPITEEGEVLKGGLGKGGKGDFTVPLKRGSAFTKKAYGSADNYVTDYNEIARSMVSGNFEETAKRQLYDKLTESGLGQILPVGETAPEFHGQVGRKLQIERRGLGGRMIIRNLFVDPKVYPEVVRAMNLDETFKHAAVTHISNVLNTIQLKGPVDALYHVANILTSISGQQGGKSVVADMVRKLPGVNVVDAIARVSMKARKVILDSPQIREDLAEIARIGAGRAERTDVRGMGKLIQAVDRAARLVRNDMYDNLVERNLAKDSEHGRREFINQVGQYNTRLMGQITAKLKEWGVSPFIVAGRTFNTNALRRVTANPGIESASTAASVKMRAVEVAGLVANLVAIPMAINYALSGKPMGRPGTAFGAIDTGKTDTNGKAIIVDPQQWTGVRRGLRLTGVNAISAGVQRGEGAARIADSAAKDMIGGFIHPFAGPAVNTAATLATGYNASGFKQAKTALPGQSQMTQNAIAAAKQLNPFIGNTSEGLTNDFSLEGLARGAAKPLASAMGLKETSVITPEQQMKIKAGQFNDKLGILRGEDRPSPYLPLSKAVNAGNFEKSQQALGDLLEQKAQAIPGPLPASAKEAMAKRAIADYYHQEETTPFTGSLARERAFKATLSADELQQYEMAKANRRQTAQSVRNILFHQ
jgi:hypothetical protein